MTVRARIAFLVIAAAIGALLLSAYLYDNSRSDLIAPGVRIAGVKVGGLRAPAARARGRPGLRRSTATWITLRYGAMHFTLTGAQAHLTEDLNGAVRQAVRTSRGGWFVGRAIRELSGGRVNQNVPLRASYRRGPVAQLISRALKAIDRPARDASVAVNGSGSLVTVKSRRGTTVDLSLLRAEVTNALSNPTSTHVVRISTRSLKPKVTTGMLVARYPTYIVVDRPGFK